MLYNVCDTYLYVHVILNCILIDPILITNQMRRCCIYLCINTTVIKSFSTSLAKIVYKCYKILWLNFFGSVSQTGIRRHVYNHFSL